MRVEVAGEHTRGGTVVDLHGRMGWEPNVTVGLRLDRTRYWDLVVGAVRDLGGASRATGA